MKPGFTHALSVKRLTQTARLVLRPVPLALILVALSSSIVALTSPRFAAVRSAPFTFNSYREIFKSGSARALSPAPLAICTWTGAGGDGLWATATNWSGCTGGGVPAANDFVVIDNTVAAGSFTVTLPTGAVVTSIAKLTIAPTSPNIITVTLPSGNTGVPGFQIGDNTASTDDIILSSGAILKNSSGAASGNGIEANSTANGTVKILNGAKYIHNSGRSTAGTVPILSTAAGTETGIFEYDVPGTGSVAISASARNYGSLTLTRTAGAATYSSTGGGALTIRGAFLLNSGITYSSTMTGAMNIAGDLTNNGAALTLPAGQAVVFNGTSNQTVSGSNTITIAGTTTVNAGATVTFSGSSSITLAGTTSITAGGIVNLSRDVTGPNTSFTVNGTLNCGTSVLSSNGTFTTTPTATLGIGSADGITTFPNATGNIRTTNRNYGTSTAYTYNGTSAQVTGNGLPTNGTGTLTINNSAGVTLSQATSFSNFTLTSGNLTTTASNLLTVSNTATSAITGGSSTSYVNGPLARGLPASLVAGSTYSFPVGKGSYNPFDMIDATTTGAITVTAEVFDAGGGTPGTGMGSLNSNRRWSATSSGSFTSTRVRLTDSSVAAGNLIGKSDTGQSGSYNSIGGTVSPPQITSDPITSFSFFAIGAGPAPDFTIADVSQAEGNAGTSTMTFTVTKTGGNGFGSTINYQTNAGTATQGTCGAGIDYESASGLLTFSPTDTTRTISVPICGDTSAEPDETFTVQLATPTNATISDPTATGTIQNDDGAVTYTWDPTTATALVGCPGPLAQAWICPANWTPLRPTAASASTTDILIFNGTTTLAPTILRVPTQTIAAFQAKNNVNEAKFEADGPVTLTINGNTGSDFSIEAGSSVRLQGTNGITISVTAAGTEGNIAGSLVFQGAAHQLTGANTDEIVFQNLSIFTTTSGFTGHPFGSGTFHSVNLGGGSSSFYGAGLDPFGGAGNEVAYFGLLPMSNQEFSAATAFDSNGRNYGNLTLTGGQTFAGSGSGQTTVAGNFVLESTSTLTLSSTSGGDLNLLGNFTDNNSSLTAFQSNGRIVKFQGGSATQTIFKNTIIGEIFSHLNITKTGGSVQLLISIAINGQLTFGGTAGSAVDVLELNTKSVSLGGTLGAAPDGNSGFKGDVNGGSLFIGVNASSLGNPIHFVSGGEFLTQFSLDRASGASIDTNLTIGHPTTTPNGVLTLTNGVLDMGVNTVALNQNATVSRNTGYVNGSVKKTFPGALAFTFPVGTGTGSAYSPVDVNVTSGVGNSLTVKAVGTSQPNVPVGNKLQRYWTLSNIGPVTADVTFNWLATDVVGLEQYYKIFKYDGTLTQFNPDVLDTGSHFATLNNVSSFSDWTLAQPTAAILSLTRLDPNPTNAASVQWQIVFDAPISGLTTSNFTLVNGGLTSPSLSTVVASGSPPSATWVITASTGTGSGTLGLDMTNDGSLSHAITNQPFTGEVYTIDRDNPVLNSFTRFNPAGPGTSDDTLVFRATFSEDVQNVDTADFAVNSTSTATVSNVTPFSASVYDVTVSGGDLAGFNGTVNLDLSGTQNITDLAGNALPAGEPGTDETYTVTNAAAGDTDVTLSGGNLVITDVGSATDDTLTLSRLTTPDRVRVNDPTHTLSCGAGMTQVDANTCDVPLASITGNIQVNTQGGNDSLTIDFVNGNLIPSGGVAYDGGSQTSSPGDKLIISGGAQGTVTYNYTSGTPGAGSVDMSSYGTVSYTGLEPLTNTGDAVDTIFNLPAGPTAATLEDDGVSNTMSRLSGATFETTDFDNPSNSLTINRGNPADTMTVNALPDFNANLTIGSSSTPFAGITLAGAITVTSTRAISVAAGDVSGAGNVTTGGGFTVFNTNFTSVLSGVIGGAGGFNKVGIGALELSGTNTYAGATTITDGILVVSVLADGGTPSNIGQSGNAAQNLVMTNGVLDYIGTGHSTDRLFTMQVAAEIENDGSGPLNFTNTGSINSGTVPAILTLCGIGANVSTFAPDIPNGFNVTSQPVALDMVGFGTWNLNGASTYTGDTTVFSGTLNINGSITSNTTVDFGATVGGTGTINSANTLTVNSGGTVAPGTSPGILNTGNVTFNSGSTFDVEINGTTAGTGYDQLNVSGSVALGGATLDLSGSHTPAVGNTFVIVNHDSTDGVTGNFTMGTGGSDGNGGTLAEGDTITSFLGSGLNATITYLGGTDTNDVVITVTAAACIPPATVYVDDSWVGTTPGTDPDAGGPATNFGCDSFATVQGGVTGVAAGGTVIVYAGNYIEDVAINNTGLQLLGAGAGTTTISGAINGPGATVQIFSNNVTVAGFTITREGNNTTDWNNPGLNSAGFAIQGTTITGALIRDNVITGNRTGIDINNSGSHTIRNNAIDFNRTGMIFRNQTDNMTVVENFITNNWTVGVLFLDASGGTNSPVQQALNSVFTNNDISANWYGQVVDRQTGGSLPAPNTTNLKNFRGNWWGTTTPFVTTANSAEPGYAAQIPVLYGGTAAPPGGQPDIAGPASANIKYIPLLTSGTDTNVETTPGRGTNGFQGQQANIIVRETNLDGWVQQTSGTATTSFVVGPGTPPLGEGSGQLTVGPDGNSGAQFRQTTYNGTPLSDLTTLTYSTYTANDSTAPPIGDQTVYIILNVDLDGNGTNDTLLFFEPEYQHGYTGTVPDQGDNVLNTWQTWDALAGGWWSTTSAAGADPGANVKPLSTIIAAFPNARIHNSATTGSLRVVAGFGAGSWDNFVGNVDNVTIGVNTANTTYDFEPLPRISIDDVTHNEGNAGTTSYTFNVTLSGPSDQTITVNYSTADDSATAPSDYTAISSTGITFNPGETSKPVTVFVNGDTTFETNEQFFVNLSGAVNGTILDGQGVGTITNDDTQPTISIDDVTMSEGNAGTTDFNFTVSLSNASYQTITVNAQTADDTATTADSDYTGVGSTLLTFAPNTTTQQFHVFVNGDTKFEPNEQFFVNLSGATNATILDGQGVGAITNDDTQPTISISDVTMSEGNAGTTDFDFTVSLSNASYQTITVNAQTADDTATTADSDYTGVGSTLLTFAPNTTTQQFHVFVNGDTKFEPNEQFFVNLSGATNATILDGQGVGTISNDDTQPTISINDVTMNETNSGTVDFDFTVSISNASYQTITVNAQTADDTATTADSDYTAAGPTTLTFAANTTTPQHFHVFVNGDTKFELNDQFFVNLSGETNATILDGQGVGTITNDDTQPTISINDVTMNETNSGTVDFDFTVSLSNASYQTITVNAQTADNTATTADLDYTAAGPTTLTFTPNTTTQQFHVFVNGDTKFELNDQFFVNLSGETNATILDGQGVGTITNDDTQPTISINNVTMNEGNAGTTDFDFTVSLSNASYQTITVNAQSADDTATTADLDYTAAGPTTLTFTENTTTQQFHVFVNGDTKFELNDQFFVNLSGETNATILDGQGVGTITNDDTQPTISINDVTLSEGNSGTTNFDFTVSISNASYQTITVSAQTADNTATTADLDYTSNTQTVTFPANTTGPQTFQVLVTGDTKYEHNDAFFVNLSGETNSTIADGQGVGTINNDDAAPRLVFTVAPSDTEGTLPSGGTKNFVFNVHKFGDTGVTATVDYATQDGVADPATGNPSPACSGSFDYQHKSASLSFAPNETDKTITILVCRDAVYETNETFLVNLTNPVDAQILPGDETETATIINDDSPGASVVVNTTADHAVGTCDPLPGGDCTLREAIVAANSSTSAVAINFGIPATDGQHYYYADDNIGSPGTPNGTVTLANVTPTTASDDTTIVGIDPDWAHSWWSIRPTSAIGPMPAVTRTVVIDGYTQCQTPSQCAQVNTSATSTNAVLRIEVDGENANLGSSGLTIVGGFSIVRGLVINRHTGDGIVLQSGSGDSLTGNFIGTDVSGTLDLGNTGNGILASSGSHTIGGSSPDLANLISGNDVDGINFSSISNQVRGNYIGTAANGTSALPNGGVGVNLSSGGAVFNVIGGVSAGEANTIAFNTLDGVRLNVAGVGNSIRGNSIYSNGSTANDLGIDLGTDGVTPNDDDDPDTGPNNLQNFPVITGAMVTGSTRTINGTLNSTPNATFNIDFYQGTACDTSGNGEGQTYLGSTSVTTDAGGDASFTYHPATLTIGLSVTATATSTGAQDNTSEFSACVTVANGASGAGDIQFTDGTYSVNENGGNASITLTRVGGTNGSISATFTTSNGTADTSDYTDSDQTVTFLENETSKTILVPITDDPVYEGDETVLLALGTSVINGPLTNAPPTDPHAAVLTIVENDPFGIAVRDARVAEPASGTAQMLFTVTLQAAAATPVTVDYQTQNGGSQPANGSPICSGLADYVITSGTLTFAPGERVKTVAVDVCSDSVVEIDETLLLNISNASLGAITRPQATGTITTTDSAGTVLISELRTSGPAGPGDDFVEIYNNSNTPLTVAASDASAGYGLFKIGVDCNATPVLIGTIPNGTVIPARGHYLFVGSQYSLTAYAAGDVVLTQDIEADRNVALFSTADINELSSLARLDAVGFGTNTGGGVCDLFREGTPLPPVSGSATEHAFLRKLCGEFNNGCETPGIPKDTNNNSEDLMFVDTAGTLIPGVPQRLGAPGPENLASPLRRDPSINVVLLDVSQAQSTPPNRVRDFTSDSGNASPFGTLSVRRRVVNNTGANVTQLRFRIVELTTFPPPSGRADLRARNSTTIVVSGVNDANTCNPNPAPCSVTVKGTTLEEPPIQPPSVGGGYNATLAEGTVTIGTPLAPGASTNVQFLLGVKTTGVFRFLIIVEALP